MVKEQRLILIVIMLVVYLELIPHLDLHMLLDMVLVVVEDGMKSFLIMQEKMLLLVPVVVLEVDGIL